METCGQTVGEVRRPAPSASDSTFAPPDVQKSRGAKLEVQSAPRFSSTDFCTVCAPTFQNSKSHFSAAAELHSSREFTVCLQKCAARLLHHLAQFNLIHIHAFTS